MNSNDKISKILHIPHVTVKTSMLMKKYNTIVLKVDKQATKKEIKNTIQKIFNIKIKHIKTLIVKGKKKRFGKYMGHRSSWKKAYIFLNKGNHLDLMNIKDQ